MADRKMKLEQQVTSFDLSKRLNELGVKQHSQFYWYLDMGEDINGDLCGVYNLEYREDISHFEQEGQVDRLSAFTASELGEMLPARLELSPKRVKELLGLDDSNNELFLKGIDDLARDQCTFQLGMDLIADRSWNYYYLQDYDLPYMINNSTENWDKNEANARAKMLIYLLENKIIQQ